MRSPRNSLKFAAFFPYGLVLGSFFLIGTTLRLRSSDETASYGLNSAVDSLGAAMSAFEGDGGHERGAAARRRTSELAPNKPSATVERRRP
jgi:hypothetical protein